MRRFDCHSTISPRRRSRRTHFKIRPVAAAHTDFPGNVHGADKSLAFAGDSTIISALATVVTDRQTSFDAKLLLANPGAFNGHATFALAVLQCNGDDAMPIERNPLRSPDSLCIRRGGRRRARGEEEKKKKKKKKQITMPPTERSEPNEADSH